MHHLVKTYLSEQGRLGGRAGKGKAKARTSEQARKAARIGWEKRRARTHKVNVCGECGGKGCEECGWRGTEEI